MENSSNILLPQEIWSIIYNHLLPKEKEEISKDALIAIARSSLVCRAFRDDKELRVLQAKVLTKDCPVQIQKICVIAARELGHCPYTTVDSSNRFVNWSEMAYPFAFVDNKATGNPGIAIRVSGKGQFAITPYKQERKMAFDTVADGIFLVKKYCEKEKIDDWMLMALPIGMRKFYQEKHIQETPSHSKKTYCEHCLREPVCGAWRWLPILSQIVSGKDPDLVIASDLKPS